MDVAVNMYLLRGSHVSQITSNSGSLPSNIIPYCRHIGVTFNKLHFDPVRSVVQCCFLIWVKTFVSAHTKSS